MIDGEKIGRLIGLWVAALLGIVATWYVAVMHGSHAFAALWQQDNLISLTMVLVPFVALCAAHYRATGSLDPVDVPAAEERPAPDRVPDAPPVPPVP